MKIEFSNRLLRLPPYLFGDLNDLKLKLRKDGRDIIDFGMGNPDKPVSKHIIDKMREVLLDPRNHRYSVSRGIYNLRKAVAFYYSKKYGVNLNPDDEVIAVIGTKEGLAHLSLALLGPGDTALVPNPAFPIHIFSVVLAGANIIHIPLTEKELFLENLERITSSLVPKPKVLFLNYPNNPTTRVVDLDFFNNIVKFARNHNIIVVHDFAYADIVFDGYKAPSYMQAKGAKNVGVEFFTMSKSYNMPGWRIGFCVGNKKIISALAKIKGYYDYGIFQSIQISTIVALKGPQDCVIKTAENYRKRRDVLIEGLKKIGWVVTSPKATMFVWAKIPEKHRKMKSLKFSKLLLEKADVAVSPGIGFGSMGDDYLRFALVENELRIKQAVRQMNRLLKLQS